jgi:N6-L-threonylcarbamoyladenine synthase
MKNEHELTWLGGTLDDAAGEAFDKGARLLGFENRGGPAIAQAAREYKIENSELKIKLPRPMMDDSLNFSFSGLKTALLREVNKLKETNQWNPDTIQQLAYELQEAITDVLIRKTIHAVHLHEAKSILISGGVSANERLREKFIQRTDIPFFSPPIGLCTDNAVTIATYAYFQNQQVDWDKITAQPDLSVEVNTR